MNVTQMYKKTKAWMYEKPSSTIYDNYIIEICNKILAELYVENNMRRMFKGKLPFVDGIEAHLVNSMSDEIDYEEEYQFDVIPKGIDASFLMDDDLSKMSILQVEYNNARVANQCLVPENVVNELTAKAEAEV